MSPWTVAPQAPLSVRLFRQEYWMGCHFLPQRIFLTQGLKPCLLHWQVGSLPLSHQGCTAGSEVSENLPQECRIEALLRHFSLKK